MKSFRKFPSGGLALAIALLGVNAAVQAQVPTSGLVGYWTGNGNPNDSSPTGNNGSFAASSYAPGPGGVGEAFNLASGGVTIADNAAYAFSGSNSFSVGLWFNFNGSTGGAQDIIGQDGGPGPNPKWFIDYNFTYAGSFGFQTGPANVTIQGPVAPLTGWHQLTVTESGDDYSWYLDGAFAGSQTVVYAWPNPSAPLLFSFADGGSQYRGLLADVTLYNRALSGGEVADLANPVPEPETYAMLLAGFGLVGVFAGSRRKVKAA